jgi:hypothetical protein
MRRGWVMPDGRFLVGVVAGAAAVLVLGGLGTRLLPAPSRRPS